MDNAIQIVRTGGLRIAKWGDNRAAPDGSRNAYLKNIDVLVLSVDHVLTRSEVDSIVVKYDPKAVIPAHYCIAGLIADGTGLKSADDWVDEQEKLITLTFAGLIGRS